VSTLDLNRAKFALKKIEDEKDPKLRENLLIELRDLPSRLHTAGLGQTIASLLASSHKNEARRVIYHWLEEWLRKAPIPYPGEKGLIDCVVGKVPSDLSYTEASREARALATWLKKFAEAFITKSEPAKGHDHEHPAAAAAR
jgi:CRISPR type III-B/RAMP module-associated protein Cmr5